MTQIKNPVGVVVKAGLDKVVHVDCAFCAAVIQPVVLGSSVVPSARLTGSSFNSSSSSSRPNQRKKTKPEGVHNDTGSVTRHIVLPTLPGLVQSPQGTKQLISEGFHAVERIAGLTQSTISIGWTNTPNLGKVLNKATSKGLKQRK